MSFVAAGVVLVLLATAGNIHGFVLPSKQRGAAVAFQSRQQRRYNTVVTSTNMCICIDCARVTNCAAYHFVETKHEQPHMTDNPTFEPREGSPTIHVNIRTIANEDQKREMERMYREHEGETKRAMEKQQQRRQEEEGGDGSATDGQQQQPLYGETVYDAATVTTYEYDVVKCEDFVSDPGCWVRNMPEEIRLANPDFVPT